MLLDIGTPLVNRLLLYDGLSLDFRVVKYRKNKECPLCNGSQTELIDYLEFCGLPASSELVG